LVREWGRVVSPVDNWKLDELERRLSERDLQILGLVGSFRLMSARQLLLLMFEKKQQRLARRVLARLVALGLLDRLERRVGGVRAGSAGFIYQLSASGQRIVMRLSNLTDNTRVRRLREPSGRFVDHTLAVADLFVRLHVSAKSGELELLQFDPEPDCWRDFIGPFGVARQLKPDSFAALAEGEWEYRWFVEVDRATEGTATLTGKMQAYVDYWRSGVEQAETGMFPRVAWLTTTETQEERLRAVIDGLEAAAQPLFVVGGLGQEVGLLLPSNDKKGVASCNSSAV
jgi:hypothetical protein